MDGFQVRPPALAPPAAAALVFAASGAVLVLEILALRMLAPYVGVSIETYTAIIGVVLGGIALGSALGGRAADAVDPRPLLGLLLVAGGLLAMATVPLVRVVGEIAGGTAEAGALLIALLAFFLPAAVLSAVTPATARLQLGDLRQTGSVVGRLSAWATAGALAGTFAAGFLVVPYLPTPASVLVLGGALVVVGVALLGRFSGARRAALAGVAAGAIVLAGAGAAAGSPCQAESTYHCVRIVADEDRPSGRLLLLDDLRHSYVDVEDPRHLEFPYVRWIAAAIEAQAPAGAPLDAVFVGGGAFTLPRWLSAVRPGSRSTVLEIDGQLVEVVRERLGLPGPPALRVLVGDARVRLDELAASSADVVVGDAFGGRAVPWHLATTQFMRGIRRVLRPSGVYAMNVIDHGSLRLARAVAATLRRTFPHVALIGEPGPDGAPGGGNLVFLAGERPPALADVAGARLYGERFVARFAADADPLTDDHAPADQLLTPAP